MSPVERPLAHGWATTRDHHRRAQDAALHALDARLRAALRRRDLRAAQRALDDATALLARLEPRRRPPA